MGLASKWVTMKDSESYKVCMASVYRQMGETVSRRMDSRKFHAGMAVGVAHCVFQDVSAARHGVP
jgi:hypothetical protein